MRSRKSLHDVIPGSPLTPLYETPGTPLLDPKIGIFGLYDVIRAQPLAYNGQPTQIFSAL